ncbi:sigma-70 family RNA polymerase sigma factor family protein [Arthrobacter pigmenti]
MTNNDVLTKGFGEHRSHLKAVAYRLLGSISDSDDALQEAWLRAQRAEVDDVGNLGGWLTTVVARVCLNMLRSRKTRDAHTVDLHMPDPIVTDIASPDPEQEAVQSDSVGMAMLVVLDALAPPERLAFVLHDVFAVPFDDVAAIIEASPAAARQHASRARRKVKAAPTPNVDLARQHRVMDAFFAASRNGDFEALVAVLHPDVLLRADGGEARPALTTLLRGAETVAGQAVTYGQLAPFVRPVLVNGVAGVIVAPAGKPGSIMAFTVRDDRIISIDVLADPERLKHLALPA